MRPAQGMARRGHLWRFDEDLDYPFKVVTIAIPPLRERKEDIPRLVEHFLRRFAHELGRETPQVAPDVLERLVQHDWPGNVRELEHCLKQAAVLCRGGVIQREHLHLEPPSALARPRSLGSDPDALRRLAREQISALPGTAYIRLVQQVERDLVDEALRHTGGNIAKAARMLGISRPTLREKIQKYDLRKGASLLETEDG